MEVFHLKWVIGIGIGVVTILWLAMEIATLNDKGKGFRSYFKVLKKNIIIVTCLFAVAGVIYYGYGLIN